MTILWKLTVINHKSRNGLHTSKIYLLYIDFRRDLGLAVLTQVTKKAMTLFASTNFVLDPEKEERAKDMYQNYVADYRSQLKFGDEEQEQTGEPRVCISHACYVNFNVFLQQKLLQVCTLSTKR